MTRGLSHPGSTVGRPLNREIHLAGGYPWSRRETGKDIPGQMDLPVEGTAYRAAGM